MRALTPIPPWLVLAALGLPAHVVFAAGSEIIAGLDEKTVGSVGSDAGADSAAESTRPRTRASIPRSSAIRFVPPA